MRALDVWIPMFPLAFLEERAGKLNPLSIRLPAWRPGLMSFTSFSLSTGLDDQHPQIVRI
jgi:hypothetical protein